jgi:hypothetical protein
MKIFRFKNIQNDENLARTSEEEDKKSKGASRKAASRYDQCSLENEEVLVETPLETQKINISPYRNSLGIKV